MRFSQPQVVKRLLLSPTLVRRAAARNCEPEVAWLLLQPHPVRESFVREVLEAGDGSGEDHRLREIWMLRQPDEVRLSYVREILDEPSSSHSSGFDG